jgi:hypothetical protein
MGWKGCDGLFALDETNLDCHATTSPLHPVFAGIDGFAFNLDLLGQTKFPLIASPASAAEEKTNAAPTNMIETFANFIYSSLYVESKSNRQQYDLRLVKKFRRGNRWTRQVTKTESQPYLEY